MLERYAPEHHPLPQNPNGWFAVGLSHELSVGDVKPVSCLGHDLVLFRTMTGKVGVLDAYCPHIGTHLSLGGCVEGESLRCPFHRWAFDVGRRCVDSLSGAISRTVWPSV
jgi:phenylpropionate dioxygenase-like ring-hydroxylating dioxygenase large terminal subunit